MSSGRILKDAVYAAMVGLGIEPGDAVFMHSDAIVVAQYSCLQNRQGIDLFLDALVEYVSPRGTLLLPTFTYSFTKGEVYDVRRTPSQVGAITEVFRLRSSVLRSGDPIFSVAACGRDRDLYAACDARHCFGEDSVFGKLHQENAWLLGCGCGFDRTTFVHYVEKQNRVDYRYDKTFSGIRVLPDGTEQSCHVVYFVRDLTRKTVTSLARLQKELRNRGALRTASLGRVGIWAVKARDFCAAAGELLAGQSNALIEEGKS